MCPRGYHHYGFVETHALGHMIYGYITCPRQELPQSHCGNNWTGTIFSRLHIYITPILLS